MFAATGAARPRSAQVDAAPAGHGGRGEEAVPGRRGSAPILPAGADGDDVAQAIRMAWANLSSCGAMLQRLVEADGRGPCAWATRVWATRLA